MREERLYRQSQVSSTQQQLFENKMIKTENLHHDENSKPGLATTTCSIAADLRRSKRQGKRVPNLFGLIPFPLALRVHNHHHLALLATSQLWSPSDLRQERNPKRPKAHSRARIAAVSCGAVNEAAVQPLGAFRRAGATSYSSIHALVPRDATRLPVPYLAPRRIAYTLDPRPGRKHRASNA